MSVKKGIGLAVAILLVLGAEAAEPDVRIKRMLEQNNIKYTINSDRSFRIPFEDGNTVTVDSRLSVCNQLYVREIRANFGEIGRRRSTLLYRMLEQSGQSKLGAFSVVTGEGTVHALFTVKLPSDANWRELWSAILCCASAKLPDEK